MPGTRCALVVDDSTAARHRVATLLMLGGWEVHEATSIMEALRKAAHLRPDLVVTEASLHSGNGIGLVHMMRRSGSRARFLVVTTQPTARVRALAEVAGAGACLAKPVDPQQLLDFLCDRTTGPVAQGPARVTFRGNVLQVQSARADRDLPDEEDDGASYDERAREMYVSALPHRLAKIADCAREGDAESVAWFADLLADASDEAGVPQVATLCTAIASDARRGVVAQKRLMQLVVLASGTGA